MACKDCPEQTPSGIPDVIAPEGLASIGWVVYTGGPPELHLAMMQHTLPADYQKGQFLPDGSIQYEKRPDDWEPPGPIEGYERDTEDAWLFRPLWKSCRMRLYSTVVKEACECIQVVAICSDPESELDEHGKIPFEVCEDCPRREPIPVRITPKRTPLPEPFRSPESVPSGAAQPPQS